MPAAPPASAPSRSGNRRLRLPRFEPWTCHHLVKRPARPEPGDRDVDHAAQQPGRHDDGHPAEADTDAVVDAGRGIERDRADDQQADYRQGNEERPSQRRVQPRPRRRCPFMPSAQSVPVRQAKAKVPPCLSAWTLLRTPRWSNPPARVGLVFAVEAGRWSSVWAGGPGLRSRPADLMVA